ncbi:MAG: hypothetical protein FWG40_09795 [Peptococcaceae bacterium]|nr:hypothetical protein [Peptococcaceae bacterium]
MGKLKVIDRPGMIKELDAVATGPPGMGIRAVDDITSVKPRTFASPDAHVGETATAIDAKFPRRVKDVNQKAYRPDGSELTDFDIALTDDIVIQVKEGGARRLEAQIMNSSAEMKQYGMTQEVIGYAPDLDLAAKADRVRIANAEKQGIKIFTTEEDLLHYLSTKQ